jgi:hypothetical protein
LTQNSRPRAHLHATVSDPPLMLHVACQ